jgi:hypothetical protein
MVGQARTRISSSASSTDVGLHYLFNKVTGVPGTISTKAPGTQATSKISDLVGVHDGVFTVQHDSLSGNIRSGEWQDSSSQNNRRRMVNWPIVSPTLPFGNLHLSGLGEPSDPAAAVSVLKITNPSRPLIDLPVSLVELRDIPDLIHQVGGSIIQKAGKGNLTWQFGLLPVVSDFLKICRFQESVKRRVELLSKFKDGPLTRKATLGSFTKSDTSVTSVVLQSSPFFINGRRTNTTTTQKVWGYVTYTPSSEFEHLARSPEELLPSARQIIGGLTIDPSTIWQALPWSWLADWFSNLGDYLEAHRNLLPLSASVPSICRTTVTEVSYAVQRPGANDTGYTWGTLTYRQVTKQRAKASASLPSASLPFLSGRQVGILASLAVTRR